MAAGKMGDGNVRGRKFHARALEKRRGTLIDTAEQLPLPQQSAGAFTPASPLPLSEYRPPELSVTPALDTERKGESPGKAAGEPGSRELQYLLHLAKGNIASIQLFAGRNFVSEPIVPGELDVLIDAVRSCTIGFKYLLGQRQDARTLKEATDIAIAPYKYKLSDENIKLVIKTANLSGSPLNNRDLYLYTSTISLLLDNAIKHAFEDDARLDIKEVEITVEFLRDGCVKLTYVDNGLKEFTDQKAIDALFQPKKVAPNKKGWHIGLDYLKTMISGHKRADVSGDIHGVYQKGIPGFKVEMTLPVGRGVSQQKSGALSPHDNREVSLNLEAFNDIEKALLRIQGVPSSVQAQIAVISSAIRVIAESVKAHTPKTAGVLPRRLGARDDAAASPGSGPLPLERSASAPPVESRGAHAADSRANKRVMIIDDDKITAMVLSGILVRIGFKKENITVVVDGALAIDTIGRCEPFDIVFCDKNLKEPKNQVSAKGSGSMVFSKQDLKDGTNVMEALANLPDFRAKMFACSSFTEDTRAEAIQTYRQDAAANQRGDTSRFKGLIAGVQSKPFHIDTLRPALEKLEQEDKQPVKQEDKQQGAAAASAAAERARREAEQVARAVVDYMVNRATSAGTRHATAHSDRSAGSV